VGKKSLIGLLLLLLLIGCSTKATFTPEMEVEKLLQNYLKALEDNDLSTLVKLSDDIRFPDKKEQMKEYQDINSEISETRIIEISAISPTEFEATISVVDVDGELELKFPVKKEKNKWKLIVGHSF